MATLDPQAHCVQCSSQAGVSALAHDLTSNGESPAPGSPAKPFAALWSVEMEHSTKRVQAETAKAHTVRWD